MDQARFYDDIAEYYDLIYSDWEGSMRRHGAAISAMLGRPPEPSVRICAVPKFCRAWSLNSVAHGARRSCC